MKDGESKQIRGQSAEVPHFLLFHQLSSLSRVFFRHRPFLGGDEGFPYFVHLFDGFVLRFRLFDGLGRFFLCFPISFFLLLFDLLLFCLASLVLLIVGPLVPGQG